MKTNVLKILNLLVFASILIGCESKEDQIKSDAKHGLPQLAVMSSVYFAQYNHLKINHVYTDGKSFDDYYLRKDVETRFYGFTLDEVINSIKVEGDTLTVKLTTGNDKLTNDELKEWKLSDATTNNETVFFASSAPNFVPPLKDGKSVIQTMNQEITEEEKKYSSQIVEKAQGYAKFYFEMLAKKNGLKLNVIESLPRSGNKHLS